MAETTEYLGLTRPTEADFFSVSHFSENMDTLDANAEATAAATAALQQEIGTGLADVEAKVDTINGKIGASGDTGTSTLFGKLNSGGSLIKSIQHVIQSFSYSNKEQTTTIQTVNTAKCIVLLERLYDSSTRMCEVTYTLTATELNTTADCGGSTDRLKMGFWIVEFI